MSEAPEFVPIEGGCLCRAVRYKITQAPPYQLMCMCTDCQSVGGGFGQASVIALNGAVTITQGNDNLISFTLPDNSVDRKFCKVCGTHVTAGDPSKPVIAVHAGTLDDRSRYQPQVAIWCQSKAKFFDLPKELPQFPQYPPPAPE